MWTRFNRNLFSRSLVAIMTHEQQESYIELQTQGWVKIATCKLTDTIVLARARNWGNEEYRSILPNGHVIVGVQRALPFEGLDKDQLH